MTRPDRCSTNVLMDKWTREHLRVILSVTLSLVPRRIKKDWAERVTANTEPAKAEIVGRLVSEIDRHFDVEKKPDVPVGPSLVSRQVSGEK